MKTARAKALMKQAGKLLEDGFVFEAAKQAHKANQEDIQAAEYAILKFETHFPALKPTPAIRLDAEIADARNGHNWPSEIVA